MWETLLANPVTVLLALSIVSAGYVDVLPEPYASFAKTTGVVLAALAGLFLKQLPKTDDPPKS